MDEVELLKKCVEIPSISGEEGELSKFLLNRMKKLGFAARIDSIGNVIGQIGQEEQPVLLLCSHIDTVVGTIPVKLEDGKLYGRGAVDAKGSLIAMVCAAARFAKKKIPGKIIVAGIVEEETTLRGIRTLLDSLYNVNFANFGEPSGVNRICVASKGRIHLHLFFKTESGNSHVSTSEKNVNAIHVAIDFWNQFKNRMFQTPFLGKTPYFSVEPNITVIKAGEATNILPDSCDVDIDIRFPPGIKYDEIMAEIDAITGKLEQETGVTINFEVLSQIEGYRVDKDTKVAQALKKAIEEVTGSEAKFLRKAGTNFMTIIGNRLQIPVVSYGPGDPSLEHTPNEHIDIAEYKKSIDVLEKFISNVLSY
ncbi:MAG: M20/M25/M40 family metallo-hydrolase [Candidatus Helarchaeota archaeon]|nr:M20/M25/M40 family metallo-hydrolase [Candidatus Helarchaeota archaeon]